METASKIHTITANKSVANTTTGGRSMPAVPVLQQRPKEQEETPQLTVATDRESVSKFAADTTPPPPDDNRKHTKKQ